MEHILLTGIEPIARFERGSRARRQPDNGRVELAQVIE